MKQNKSEPGTFGGHAYDSIMMLVEALKSVGPDKKKMKDYIETNIKKWPVPAVSSIFHQTTTAVWTRMPLEMVVVKNGNWEILK